MSWKYTLDDTGLATIVWEEEERRAFMRKYAEICATTHRVFIVPPIRQTDPMSYDIPCALPHLSAADRTEIERLLTAIWKDDNSGANRWLNDNSDYFRAKPVDVLKRDEIGVVRVISYLKHASP